MPYTPVTVADFKAFFARDFPYGTDPVTSVLDADITKALMTAGVNFNEGLWESQNTFSTAYLYLSAHFLVDSIKASSSGLSSQYAGNTTSKSVGNVSESYQIPDTIKNTPWLAGLYTSKYGEIFLTLISPRLVGNVVTMRGWSTPW